MILTFEQAYLLVTFTHFTKTLRRKEKINKTLRTWRKDFKSHPSTLVSNTLLDVEDICKGPPVWSEVTNGGGADSSLVIALRHESR